MNSVLLVEDDKTVLRLVAKWLGRYSAEFDVYTAENGQVAIETLNTTHIDLVVTDLLMPVLDGFELITRMMSRFPEMPVIVMTALGLSTVEDRLHKIGTFPVLQKPLNVTALYNAIKNELDAKSQGIIHGITLASFLQLIEAEKKTCTLRVTADGKVGYLYFSDGILVDAETGNLSGEDAAYDVIAWENQEIQITTAFYKTNRVIQRPLPNILLEAFRRRDEHREQQRVLGIPGREEEAVALSTSAIISGPSRNVISITSSRQPRTSGALAQALVPEESEPVIPVVPAAAVPAASRAIQTAESVLTMADALLGNQADTSKIYAVAPELSHRLSTGDLPQQTANLLIFFDGKMTLGDIIEIVPDQASALQFLVSGLVSTGLLTEVVSGQEVTPEAGVVASEPSVPESVPLPPLPAVQKLGAATHSYFLPSDGLMLAQSLRMSLGAVPEVTYLAALGLPHPYRAAFAETLRHIGEGQRTIITREPLDNASSVLHELAWLPMRSDLRISVISVPSAKELPGVLALPGHLLGNMLFISAHNGVTDQELEALAAEYAEILTKPSIICLLNAAPYEQPQFIEQVATALGVPPGSVACWDIQDPQQVTTMINVLIQAGMMF